MKGNIFKLLNRSELYPLGIEDSLTQRDDVIKAVPASPERGLFNPQKPMPTRPPLSLRILPPMLRIMRPMRHNIRLSLSSLDQNPQLPKTEVDESFLTEFANYAKSLGVASVDYAKLPREYIFRGKAVLFDNVIILSMEMDRDKIAMAPSPQTQIMILRTYNDLGIAANKLTDYLRQHGFAAQAGHPLGGLTVYPPLGQLAGMGWHGSHGLFIIPEFGPRHRLAAIYTNITNLPKTSQNSHGWVEDFCAGCKRCIKVCPSNAIYETPIIHDNGAKTHIDVEKCLPVFFKH